MAFEGVAARADVRIVVLGSDGSVFLRRAELQWTRRASEND